MPQEEVFNLVAKPVIDDVVSLAYLSPNMTVRRCWGPVCCCFSKVIEGINGTIFAYGPIPNFFSEDSFQGWSTPPACMISRSDGQWQNLYHHWRQMKPLGNSWPFLTNLKAVQTYIFKVYIDSFANTIIQKIKKIYMSVCDDIPRFIAGLVSFQTKQDMTKYSHHLP